MTTDMKRYTSLKSNLFSPRSSSIVSQNLVYMQMSHHYRRLLNAKSNVDSSQPRSFRTQERTRRPHRLLRIDSSDSSLVDEPTPSEMALVDRIIYDDKHRPDVIYRDHMAGTKNHNHPYPPAPPRHDCTEARRATERPKQTQRCRQSCTQRTANKPPPCDLMDRHRDVFECADPHKPRILKSTAQSRVRDLKVYHPPRRKTKSHKTEDWDIQTEVQKQHEEERVTGADDWLRSQTVQTDIEPQRPLCAQCQCDMTLEHPSSKVSIGSRDSAYNGGVSSGGESRGPTPEQVNLANLSTSIARPIARCEGCPAHVPAVQSVVPSNIKRNRKDRSPSPLPRRHPARSTTDRNGSQDKRNRKDRSPSPLPRRHPARSTTDRNGSQDKRTNRPLSCSPTRQRVSNRNKMASTNSRVPCLDRSLARDDVRYAAFSQRITADILCREILSNKGINKVFQRHMEENMDLLDMALMQKEIDMLRVQLGIRGGEDSNKNILPDSGDAFSTESIILSSESSNESKRTSGTRSHHKKEERISSSALESSNSYLVKNAFPPSNTYTTNSNVSSNVSNPRFPELNGNIPSRVCYPPCPALCSTQYGELAVHNQLVQVGDYSQNLEIALAPNEDELQLLPFEIFSPNTTVEDSVNIVPPAMETDGIMGSSSNTSTDSSPLEQTVKEMLEQLLTDNVPSVATLISEPMDIERNNEAVDNEITNVASDSEHSEKSVASSLESERSKTSLRKEERLFGNSWVSHRSDSVNSTNEPTVDNVSHRSDSVNSTNEPTVDNISHRSDSVNSTNEPTVDNILDEDPNPGSSSSDAQTRCCFIKKKKKSKDARMATNVSPSAETNKLGLSKDAISQDAPIHSHSGKLSDNDLSWEAMKESKSTNVPAASSSSQSSKSSLDPVSPVPEEPPRNRKMSDATSRRRSTYLEVLSSTSSSSNDSTTAARNFREQVRKSNEAHEIKSDTARLRDFVERRKLENK